jgi:hypothetical protein
MNRISIVLLAVLALLCNACEKHKASELEEEPGHEAAAAEHKEGAPAEAKPEEKKAEEGKPGEAPKFFPEKK